MHNATIYFDQEKKQPFMRYVDFNNKKHTVWFEDALSHYWKYWIIKEYHLRGAFYWTINMPFPSTWYILKDMFRIKR